MEMRWKVVFFSEDGEVLDTENVSIFADTEAQCREIFEGYCEGTLDVLEGYDYEETLIDVTY